MAFNPREGNLSPEISETLLHRFLSSCPKNPNICKKEKK
jgi:hypothetical protein